MGVQLEKVRPGSGNRVIYKDFKERGRYVAHNRDVRYSPTHSELSTVERHSTHSTAKVRTKLLQVREPAWPALVTVATC